MLTEKYRPTNLDEMIGQTNLVGPNGILRNIIKNGTPVSCIFYGPCGTGKTTAAMAMATAFGLAFHSINCSTMKLDGQLPEKKVSFPDMIKNLVTTADKRPFLLYVDEIQKLNKAQQALFTNYIESGDFIMIASTSANPYYEIIKDIISRCIMLEFVPIKEDEIAAFLTKIAESEGRKIDPFAIKFIAGNTAGDVRRSVNLLELAFINTPEADTDGHEYTINANDIDHLLPSMRMAHYDKDGNDHYSLKSALQKSIRGSDPNAAVFYLCRLLEGGDLEAVCRRLMVISNEDIGLANPEAVPFVYACCQMATQLGMPEANKPLTNAVIYLALSRKASTAETAYDAALQDVQKGLGSVVPAHLNEEHPKGYIWPHAYPNHWYPQQYLPDDIEDHIFYQPGDNTFEQNHLKYWQLVKEAYKQADPNGWNDYLNKRLMRQTKEKGDTTT